MKFKPLSESEVLNLLQPGEYDFVVEMAEDKISKSGNEMIKLQLSIWDNMNIKHTVFDYLLEQIMYKVKHFSDSVGLTEEYKNGGFTAINCLNLSGRCKIIIDENPDSNYPPKNAVKDYIFSKSPIKLKSDITLNKNEQIDKSLDDDLPF
jgi:hypothetical protein